MSSAGARAYNGGLGRAEPPAGYRGRAPGQGFRGLRPLKLIAFSWMYVHRSRQLALFFVFERKLQKLIFSILVFG